jgi:hypothetical protein
MGPSFRGVWAAFFRGPFDSFTPVFFFRGGGSLIKKRGQALVRCCLGPSFLHWGCSFFFGEASCAPSFPEGEGGFPEVGGAPFGELKRGWVNTKQLLTEIRGLRWGKALNKLPIKMGARCQLLTELDSNFRGGKKTKYPPPRVPTDKGGEAPIKR